MMKKLLLLTLTVLLLVSLSVPAFAADGAYIFDEANLLTDSEQAALEVLCAKAEEQYGCAVYIATMDNFKDLGYSNDVYDATTELYHNNKLGAGQTRSGVILLLSMAERDFALFVYGPKASDGLNAYAQVLLENAFLPEFEENHWYNGFAAYVDGCHTYLQMAKDGEPVKMDLTFPIILGIAISLLIAMIVCNIMKSAHKSVRSKSEASGYLSGQLTLTSQQDLFTHMTTTRTKIESSSGSSSSRSGGGGSGRSGKF